MSFNQGSRNPNAQLTQAMVDEMREAYEAGESQGSLARRFPVSIGQVGRIVRGESWKKGAVPLERLSPAATEERFRELMPSQERLEELMRLQKQPKEEK